MSSVVGQGEFVILLPCQAQTRAYLPQQLYRIRRHDDDDDDFLFSVSG